MHRGDLLKEIPGGWSKMDAAQRGKEITVLILISYVFPCWLEE
jgi:hypothetical protein